MPRDHRRDLAMEHSLKQPLMGAAPPPPYQPMPTDPVVVRRLNYQTPGECFFVGFTDLCPSLPDPLLRRIISLLTSCADKSPSKCCIQFASLILFSLCCGIVLALCWHYVGNELVSCWHYVGITDDLQEATCFGFAFLEVSVTCFLLFKFHSW